MDGVLLSSLSALSLASTKPPHPSSQRRLPLRFPHARTSLSIPAMAPSLAPSRLAASALPPASPISDPFEIDSFVKAAMPGGYAAQPLIATGRRKTAVARVCLVEGTGRVIINKRNAEEYLQGNPFWLQAVKFPLATLGYETKYDVIVKAAGGGLSGQAQAILLGIARALCVVNLANRDPLKKQGLLTRDPRCVERKKYGLKKARKAPQYSKR